MKYSFLLLCFLFKIGLSNAQNTHLESLFKKNNQVPKIYAVIVGISDYKDPDIPDLSFADRDAEIFAEFLKSNAGGSVPLDQIKLLKGSDATVANVYDALSWVKLQVKKGDKFYFYFAGHGDLESSIYQLGFLLTYDTPFQNYINNSIRIEDLNNLANTLSVQKEVNTILITDACHSGKLAGSDNRGSSLIGEQLSLVQKEEIRITSCEADQKSQENIIWGGGRGVFSYYLVKGMKGFADSDNDNLVTLQELKTYLETNVSRDVLKLKLEEQNPIVLGKQFAIISNVIEHPVDSISNPVIAVSKTNKSSRDPNEHTSENTDLITAYFKFYKDVHLENDFDFSKIITSKAKDVPELVFNSLLSFNNGKMDTAVLNSLKDPEVKDRFNMGFAAMIHDQVQEAINLYLKADEVELDKRQYYNSGSSNYEKYPIMIQTSLNLLDKDHYLYHILQVKLHYFKGISARLKIPLSTNPDSLIEFALKEQILALALEDKAAYIQNELGLLYSYKSKIELARKFYEKAIALSPTWTIPRSNLSGLLAKQKQYQDGIKSALKAITLQPRFQGAYINLGINYEGIGNWLFAEEQYRKSITLNSKHFLPFEKLGYLYAHNMSYALADSFFTEADNRKTGFISLERIPTENVLSADATITTSDGNHPTMGCNLDTTSISKNDIIAHFVWAMYYSLNSTDTKNRLKKLAAIDPSNPLLFRYLGEIYYQEKNWLEAEINFKYAEQNCLDYKTFAEYCKKIIPKQKLISGCIEEKYKSKYYNKEELNYFFGKLYETWGHFEEAQSYYEKIIRENQHDISGYYLLWSMNEKLGRYEECEEIIRNYGNQNKIQSDQELVAFYNRRINADPTRYQYFYKAGNLLYQFSKDLPPGNELNPNSNEQAQDFNTKRNEIKRMMPLENNTIPGILESIQRAPVITNPRELGISMFEQVCKLTKDTIVLTDSYMKSGDLYNWAGSKQNAINQFQKANDLMPANANIRLKIIDACHDLYLYEQGLQNLNYLFENKQINYEKMLLLVNYDIYQSKFKEANRLLSSMQSMHPIQKSEIEELKIKSAMFFGNFKQALEYYLKKANQNAKDPDLEYTVSRIYALNKDSKNAIKWLKKSLNDGFNYAKVFNYDNVWATLRKSKDWETIPNLMESN